MKRSLPADSYQHLNVTYFCHYMAQKWFNSLTQSYIEISLCIYFISDLCRVVHDATILIKCTFCIFMLQVLFHSCFHVWVIQKCMLDRVYLIFCVGWPMMLHILLCTQQWLGLHHLKLTVKIQHEKVCKGFKSETLSKRSIAHFPLILFTI